MGNSAKRVAAGLLVLIGAVLGLGGLWLTTALGTSGTATFTTSPTGEGSIIIPPSVLNRVDAPVTVRVDADKDAEVWIGKARPSDAQAALGEGPQRVVTGVDVRTWSLKIAARGGGESTNFAEADVWHAQQTARGSAALTLTQADAPESVVATVRDSPATQVSVTYERKAWFVQSVIAMLVGLFLILAGILTWRLRVGDPAPTRSVPPVPIPSRDQAAQPATSRTAFPMYPPERGRSARRARQQSGTPSPSRAVPEENS